MIQDDTQVVVFDYRGVNRHLRAWLKAMPHVARISELLTGPKYLLAMMRNVAAEWFLKKTDLPWLLMVNDNVIPLASISELLDCEADVAAAHFFCRGGQEGHSAHGSAAMACMKISRRALERIPRPWFKFVFNTEHTALLHCECNWFCQQAKLAGYNPVKVGTVAHVMEVALIPPEDGKEQCQMKFLHELPVSGPACEASSPSRR